MHDNPSQSELIEAVKLFIEKTASPQLNGHAAFHARVASNVLGTLLRDLDARPKNEADEQKRLSSLLGNTGDLAQLNADLCEKIRSNEMTIETSGLLEHLKLTAIAQVKVDQPRYSGLKTALDTE